MNVDAAAVRGRPAMPNKKTVRRRSSPSIGIEAAASRGGRLRGTMAMPAPSATSLFKSGQLL